MLMTRKTGVLISSAAVGVLAFGTAGTAMALADSAAPAKAPVPKAAELSEQVTMLKQLERVLQPTNGLVREILKADDGQITEAEAAEFQDAIKSAIDAIRNSAPSDGSGSRIAAKSSDLRPKAAAELQERVNALVDKTAGEGAEAISEEAGATIKAANNLVAATAYNRDLPEADLPGLPKRTAR